MFDILFYRIHLNLNALLPIMAFLLSLTTAIILFFFFLKSRKKIFLHLMLLFLSFSFYQHMLGIILHLKTEALAHLYYRFMIFFMLLQVLLFHIWTYYIIEKKRETLFRSVLAVTFLFMLLNISPFGIPSPHYQFPFFRLNPSLFYFFFLAFYFSAILYCMILVKKNSGFIGSTILFPNIMHHFFLRTVLILILLLLDQLYLMGIIPVPPLSAAACVAVCLILIFSIFKSYVLYYEMLKKNYFQTISGLANLLDNKDNYTYCHSYRVTHYAVAVARMLKLDEETVSLIRKASLLHDIGKIGIPDDILMKKKKLTPEEWKLIKTHAAEGAVILNIADFLNKEADIIRHHHERYDGTGYPDRLPYKKIPLEAQVISLVDTFDAMTSRRPYREKYSLKEVYREFQRVKGRQFAPALVDRFLSRWDDMIELYKKLQRQIKKP